MNNTKYPRTYHFPFSPGATSDDKIVDEGWFEYLKGKELVITEKLDGSNTAIMQSGVYSRSHAAPSVNEWDEYLFKHGGIFDKVKPLISEDEIIYGENMYAVHSIEYEHLPDYFFVFNIRNSEEYYSWSEIEEMCEITGLKHVPLLNRAVFNKPEDLQTTILELMKNGSTFGNTIEGVVVRVAERFPIQNFKHNVIKYVRANHVQTDVHWTKNWKQAKLNL